MTKGRPIGVNYQKSWILKVPKSPIFFSKLVFSPIRSFKSRQKCCQFPRLLFWIFLSRPKKSGQSGKILADLVTLQRFDIKLDLSSNIFFFGHEAAPCQDKTFFWAGEKKTKKIYLKNILGILESCEIASTVTFCRKTISRPGNWPTLSIFCPISF